jgi:hypothetical protein
VPGGTRTPNLLIRSQMLYPIELQTQLLFFDYKLSACDSKQPERALKLRSTIVERRDRQAREYRSD